MALPLVAGCGPNVKLAAASEAGPGSGTESSTTGTLSTGAASGSDTRSSTASTSFTTTTTRGSSASSTAADDGTTNPATGTSSTGLVCPPLPSCTGNVYACGDGEDNDGDGLIDLDDPECIGVCDLDEGAFQNAILGEFDCRQDCYFDANTGLGDDVCFVDLDCDPLEPMAAMGCPYTKSPNCQNSPTIGRGCVDYCQPLVPNGCDCFGCCTFQTDEGAKNFYLGNSECKLEDDLAGCTECTQHMELCGNPCSPDACEICIGQTAPDPGCEGIGCVEGPPCSTSCDCEPDHVCITGCCLPVPVN